MKYLKLTVLCLTIIMQTAYSQLTITPQIGIESVRTLLKINNGSFFKAIANQALPHMGIKLDYQVKKAHSVFAGVSTSNKGASFNFENSKEGVNTYSSSGNGTKLRIDAGYQFSSKFSYRSASSKSKIISAKPGYKVKNEKLAVRFLEQIGLAYIPSVKKDFKNSDGGVKGNYTYNSGNWKLAFLYAWGFEFNKGNVKKFYINIQYMKAIGNLGSKTFNTAETETSFASRASSLCLNFGVPIFLRSKK